MISCIIEEVYNFFVNQLDPKKGEIRAGIVQYESVEKIKNHYQKEQNISHFIIWELMAAGSLFLKRKEFSHENEFRIIYSDETFCETDLTAFNLNFDPVKLIKKITLDPRLDSDVAEAYSYTIKNLGYSGPIEQSSLYKIENFNITFKKSRT